MLDVRHPAEDLEEVVEGLSREIGPIHNVDRQIPIRTPFALERVLVRPSRWTMGYPINIKSADWPQSRNVDIERRRTYLRVVRNIQPGIDPKPVLDTSFIGSQ
jgi:hypothetical protein